MSSRMKFGGDFSISVDEEFRSMPPWVPVTPQKPLLLKPHNIMLEPYGNHLPAANWHNDFGNVQFSNNSGMYNGMSQAFSPIVQFPGNVGFYGVDGGGLAPQNGKTNHIAGSFSQVLGSDSSSWNDGSLTQLLPHHGAAAVYVGSANRNLSRSVDMAANAPLTPKLHPPLHPPVANQRNNSSSFLPTNRNCNNGSYPSSAVMSRPVVVDFPSRFDGSQGHSNVANWLLNNDNHSSSANLLSKGDSSTHISPNVLPMPMPLRPSYDLNLNCLPGTEADTASCVPSQLQFTPYRANRLENNQLPSIQTSLTGESSSKGNVKQVDFFTSTGDVAIQNLGGELLQNIVESASAVISTAYKETKDSDHEGDKGIDLNQTPQQKTPKRRKHRPKVIIEGKSKRTPKPATEKNAEPKEPRTVKRKYTKKNIQMESSSQVAECTSEATYRNTENNAEPTEPRTGKRKYTRKNIQKESSSQVAEGTSEATYRNTENNAEPTEPQTGKRKYKRKNIQKESSSQVAEGKSEVTYRDTENNAEPTEPRTGKRKYTRKNIQKESSSQVAEGKSEVTYRDTGIGAKTCRRVLDFDLGVATAEKQGKAAEINQSKMKSSNVFNLENGVLIEDQRLETMSHPSPSLSQLCSNYIIHPEGQESAALLATRGDTQINNLHVAKRHADCRYESAPRPQHSHAESISKHAMRAKTNGEKHEKTKESANQGAFQSALKVLSPANEQSDSKRDYCHNIQQTHLCSNNLLSSLLCQETFESDGHQVSSGTIRISSHKKQKVDTEYLSIHHMPLKDAAVEEEGLGRFERKRANEAVSNGFAALLNHTILNSYIRSSRMKERENSGGNKCTSDRFIGSIASAHNLQKQQMPFKSNSCKEITQVVSFSTTPTTETCNQLVSSPPGKSSGRGKRQELQTQERKSARKKTVRSTALESALSSTDKLLQEQNFLYNHQQSSAKTLALPLITTYPSCMDDIIHRFSVLSINGSCNESMQQEQNALVPYKGDGAVVPYEGSEYIKKRKPRPRVELDSETNRVWNLLMGKEGSEGTEGPDKKKYWEDERKVFQGRVDSFIARMHLVQGDRRFSRWKGSVVDSVIGVFLTQNVSDHLSSSAFMSLAARFPLESMSNHQTQDKVGTDIMVKEPELCIPIPDDATKLPEHITSQPIYNPIFMAPYECAEHLRDGLTSRTERNLMEAHSQCLEEEYLSSQDSFGSSVTQVPAENRSYLVVSNSEAEDPTSRHQANKVCCNSAYPLMDKDIVFQDFYHEVQGSPLLDDGSRQRHKQWGQQKSRSDRIDYFDGTCSVTNPIILDSQKIRPSIDPSSSNHLQIYQSSGEPEPFGFESFSEESISSWWPSTASKVTTEKDDNYKSFRNIELTGTVANSSVEENILWRSRQPATKDPYGALRLHSTDQQNYSQPRSNEYYQPSCNSHQHEGNETFQLQKNSFIEPVKLSERLSEKKNGNMQDVQNVNHLNKKSSNAGGSTSTVNNESVYSSTKEKTSHELSQTETFTNISKGRKKKSESDKNNTVDWDNLRKKVFAGGCEEERNKDAMDSLDYEALKNVNVKEISNAIRERGMNNMLAERIQEFLNRVVKDHGSINLEWLRDVPPDQAKDYLLSIRGLGLKSVECVRLLTLHHLAFPVDTNVGRIAVRLGWVPLQPLPESLQLHLLELYPMLETIQKYLWPRLCKLDQLTLYELHYQMITFGKVFCTKSKPNCNACPMRGECRHFASAFASARLALPGPGEKSIVSSFTTPAAVQNPSVAGNTMSLPSPEIYPLQKVDAYRSEPIIEEPASPEQDFTGQSHSDIEDLSKDEEYDDPDDIPTINISMKQFTDTLQDLMQNNMNLQEGDLSKALVALNPQDASLPTPKLKIVSRLRTEHQVYVLPDSHPLLEGMDRREPDDPSPYLLAIWTPGETANSVQPPQSSCGSKDRNTLCNENTCFSCNSIREENSQIVRGTILVPCRTAMRGSFPLNGTYFQVNEMFADHASSISPIDVPREWIWNLPRRTVHFGTSATSIFRGLSTEEIQQCFWRGYVCVRGFDRSTRAPKPLIARLHIAQSKMTKTRDEQ